MEIKNQDFHHTFQNPRNLRLGVEIIGSYKIISKPEIRDSTPFGDSYGVSEKAVANIKEFRAFHYDFSTGEDLVEEISPESFAEVIEEQISIETQGLEVKWQ